jgi:hypothetical protein
MASHSILGWIGAVEQNLRVGAAWGGFTLFGFFF